MVEASATTNLAEVDADYLRLWQPSARNHVDVRDIFVDKEVVTEPVAPHVPVGNGEVETSLEYPGPTNDQVPALKGLLEYLDQLYPPAPVNKYYTIHRKQQAQLLGDTWLQQRRVAKTVRNLRVSVEQFAPVLIQRQVRNVKVVRPVYIFAPL